MERLNQIWKHPYYQEQFRALQQAERDRIFCNHTLEHFLDTARLMYIYDLEEQAGIPKELIYAAAFLHDIGRYQQISEGIPHEIAGMKIAEALLPECGFSAAETEMICRAIGSHRGSKKQTAKCGTDGVPETAGKSLTAPETDLFMTEEEQRQAERLADFLYRADKRCRNCFGCSAQAECNWPDEKKNTAIEL